MSAIRLDTKVQQLQEEDFCLERMLPVMSTTSGQISWKMKSHSAVHSFQPGASQSGCGHQTFTKEDGTLNLLRQKGISQVLPKMSTPKMISEGS